MVQSPVRDNYAALQQQFRWQVPRRFNIAEVCSGRWARRPDAAMRVAIHADGPGLEPRAHTYAELQDHADRLSRALLGLGVRRGDRVAIVLPQRFETAVAYIAVLQMGAVAMPLSVLFGPEALEFRINDSATTVLICDEGAIASVQDLRKACPSLRHVIGVGDEAGAAADHRFDALLASHAKTARSMGSDSAIMADTAANDPAVLIYTSGTTGNPKGALIPHRALIGNLTGFICSQNWLGFDPRTVGSDMPEPALPSVFWSPADWAWTGGLMDALLPTLYFGRPIVAWRGRFSPDVAFDLLQRYRVTHTFLFPTALKAMMKACPEPRRIYRLHLQAIMSAGEAVGDAVFAYCQQQLGVTVNEMFGQTEVNYIVGNCSLFWPARAGSMGKGYPGHRVAVIDEQGQECASGVVGEVAVHRRDIHGDPDPIFFLGYWNNEAGTLAKYTGARGPDDWCRTGDLALCDADGYLWYQGRADDMFKAAGYRIGPGEIENCLVKHAAVANAAVVPKPDPERGALVKAYVVLTPEAQVSLTDEAAKAGLVAELQQHVRGKLAPYEYPKDIEFIEALPMTTTGKVQRRILRLQEEERARQAGILRPA